MKSFLQISAILLVGFDCAYSLSCYACSALTDTSGVTVIRTYPYPGDTSPIVVVPECPKVKCPYSPGICIGKETVSSTSAVYEYSCYIDPLCVPSNTQSGSDRITVICCKTDNCNVPSFNILTTSTPQSTQPTTSTPEPAQPTTSTPKPAQPTTSTPKPAQPTTSTPKPPLPTTTLCNDQYCDDPRLCYSCSVQTTPRGETTIYTYQYPGTGMSIPPTIVPSCPIVQCPYSTGICIRESVVSSSGAALYSHHCDIIATCEPTCVQDGKNIINRICCNSNVCNNPQFDERSSLPSYAEKNPTECSNEQGECGVASSIGINLTLSLLSASLTFYLTTKY